MFGYILLTEDIKVDADGRYCRLWLGPYFGLSGFCPSELIFALISQG